MIGNGEIIGLSKKIIRPFYQQKAEKAVEYVKRELAGTPYRIHKPEGAMFLWLWFEDLPIGTLRTFKKPGCIGCFRALLFSRYGRRFLAA